MTKIIRPRCPQCGKLQHNWLDGAGGYTCRGCGLDFTINTIKDYSSHKVLSLENLTDAK